MESYSNATAYDFNDYSCNEMTLNHTGVPLCHYCHHCHYYCNYISLYSSQNIMCITHYSSIQSFTFAIFDISFNLNKSAEQVP
jgi:hypothetical protein